MGVLLALSAGIAMGVSQWLIYVYAPVEATLGVVQKIFYMHMPLALWALVSFTVIFFGSIAYLWRKKTEYDILCAAACEIGLLFAALALISGMVWARKSWGVWWTWDPRLATTLVMWFIYAGYMLIRNLDMPLERRRIVCAVSGIVAFLDVPLVFLSARIFRSIHPAVFGHESGGLEPEMKLTLCICVISLGLLWGALLLLRTIQIKQEERLNKLKYSTLR